MLINDVARIAMEAGLNSKEKKKASDAWCFCFLRKSKIS